MKKVLKKKKATSSNTLKKKKAQRTYDILGTQSPRGADKVLHFIVTSAFCFLRYVLVFFLGAFAGLTITFALCFSLYLRSVSNSSGIGVARLLSIALEGKSKKEFAANERFTILILGTDALSNRDEMSALTDTILVLSVSPTRSMIDTFSLPRDLWIASQSAKINALYAKEKTTTRQVVQTITGLEIQKQIVIDISTVGKMIDALGGLDVTVERSFIDYRFPRGDVDVRVEKNIDKLYETVAFTKGVEHMSGDRALRYIRSRHSPDPVEGTDDARVKRQQQVISALLFKIKDPILLRNPEQIGAILKLFEQNLTSDLTLEDLSTLGWHFVKQKTFPTFVPHQFTVKEVDKNGILTHPDRFPGGAWVYLPVDSSFVEMRKLVHQWLLE